VLLDLRTRGTQGSGRGATIGFDHGRNVMRVFGWTLALAFLGMLAIQPAKAGNFGNSSEIVVVTHVDIIPDSSGAAPQAAVGLLTRFVVDSRKDPGVKYFTLITWDPTKNHFQLLEVYRDIFSFNQHVSASHTTMFRDNLQQYIGAPYDERVYQPSQW
jgi:quinol monooxygenase YgiN